MPSTSAARSSGHCSPFSCSARTSRYRAKSSIDRLWGRVSSRGSAAHAGGVHLPAPEDTQAGRRRGGGADPVGRVPAAGSPASASTCGRFERLAGEGRRALAADAPGRAAAYLREALALWRGAPLAEVSDEPFAQAEIARLNELRAGVIEDRIEADLALGRHGDVVSELEALVAAHPLRERLYQQLMIALYRCGRQAEALAVYRSARRVLMQELGIEPGPGLKRLERAILEQDVSLEPPARPPERRGDCLHRGRAVADRGAGPPCPVAERRRGSARRHSWRCWWAGPRDPREAGLSLSAGPDTVGVIDGGHDILSKVVTGVGEAGRGCLRGRCHLDH